MSPKPVTYKDSGVDVDLADSLIKRLGPMIRSTSRPGVVGRVGGFSGLFKMPTAGMTKPLLVSGTDGVGTKLLVARAVGKHDTIGIDLVAMSVNDVVCCGAEPLFFLDYFATGGLEPKVYRDVMKGIVRGCKMAGCALLGGETAEMPGMYAEGDYDLAGFAVGVVDVPRLVDGSKIKAGDVVIGLKSSGPHSNGFSLIRKVFTEADLAGDWGRKLLAPTAVYVKPVLRLLSSVDVFGIAHITGGGFYDNIPRCLPRRVSVRVNTRALRVPKLFREIQSRGGIDEIEMFRTFNMGIGMVLVVREADADRAVRTLASARVRASVIGQVVHGDGQVIL